MYGRPTSLIGSKVVDTERDDRLAESRQWLDSFMQSIGKTAAYGVHLEQVALAAGMGSSTLRNVMTTKHYAKPLGGRSRAKLEAYRRKVEANGTEVVKPVVKVPVSPSPKKKAVGRYEIVNDANGDVAVVITIATFKSCADAQEYIHWKNNSNATV